MSDGSDFRDDSRSNTGGTVAFATFPGTGYTSTVSYLFAPAGDSASISEGLVLSRAGNRFGDSTGSLLANFTTDVDVSYAASGSLSNSGGFTRLIGQLYDVTTDTFLFQSNQASYFGPAVFTLGGAAGNYSNFFQGSLTGTLAAGDVYQWYGYALNDALSNDSGSTASGNVSLTIGAVPEFSSVIIWSLLALTIGGAGWLRRARLAA